MAQAYPGIFVYPCAAIVGTAMDEAVHQPLYEVWLALRPTDQPYDSTHSEYAPTTAPLFSLNGGFGKNPLCVDQSTSIEDLY
jgi:hypothetical protein